MWGWIRMLPKAGQPAFPHAQKSSLLGLDVAMAHVDWVVNGVSSDRDELI